VIVVTGADGQLGTAFRSVLPKESVFLTRADLDLTDLDLIGPTIAAIEPAIVINCAAYTAVDAAESDEETANIVNAYAVGELAAACESLGARFVTFSTDYVFDGEKGSPYVESDAPRPINAYGRSKLLGEQLALDANPSLLIVRTSWLLSGSHDSFLQKILLPLKSGQPVSVISDQIGSPTFAGDLAPATIRAAESGLSGLLHLADDSELSWFTLALEIAEAAGIDADLVSSCSAADYAALAERPSNSVLGSERRSLFGVTAMPPRSIALHDAVREVLDRAQSSA
jgi:dTDP-4-dehydrorhamnose reductase